jgi:hypothetical protein
MSRQFLKPCGILALSIALLYSGVAWAFETCLRHEGHSHQATLEHHFEPQSPVSHADSPDSSAPTIRCAWATQQVGPAVRMASPDTSRSDRGVILHTVSFPDARSAVVRNALWLEALFKRMFTFSLPVDSARHLFLSVFQI